MVALSCVRVRLRLKGCCPRQGVGHVNVGLHVGLTGPVLVPYALLLSLAGCWPCEQGARCVGVAGRCALRAG